MQITEERIKEKVNEFRTALNSVGGMGLADDASSISDESLRRLAIESLRPDPLAVAKKEMGHLDPNALIGH